MAKKIELRRADYLEWLKDQEDWVSAEIIMDEDETCRALDDLYGSSGGDLGRELQIIQEIREIVKKYEGEK